MEVEDEFVEILPRQQTAMSRHYVEDQLALAAAAAAGIVDTFRQELHSPAVTFKRLAVRQVALLDPKFVYSFSFSLLLLV